MHNSTFFFLIYRHLQKQHYDEPQMEEALSHKAGSKERKRLMQMVVNKGDLENNVRTKRNNRGKFIVMKRTSNPIGYKDYVNCVHCDGEVRQRLWSKHANKCPGLYGKKKGTLSQKQHNNDSRKRFLAKVSPEDSPAMIDLMANMKRDEVGEIALNDHLIKKIMAILLERRFEKMEGVACSRQQGRNLARLLHHMR